MGLWGRLVSKMAGVSMFVTGRGAQSKHWSRSIEQQEICISILDCNATHTAKGQVLHVVKDKTGRVAEIKRSSPYTKLFERPNPLMTRQDFLYAMSWQLDLKNTALAWVDWEGSRPKAIWPLAYQNFEFREIAGGGSAVEFVDMNGSTHYAFAEDMIVLRRHFDGSGIAGRGNTPVDHAIELVDEIDDGLTSAITISNKIHGILKQKKSMLSQSDVQKSQEDFKERVEKAAQHGGGIITLDATEEYTPLNMAAWSANAAQMKQITARLYAYWRTPQEVVANTASEQTMQNYYDSIIEPRWDELSQALTFGLFTVRERDVGNCMMVVGGAATGASWATKLAILTNTRDSGELTVNERRELLGYGPTEDGDKRLVSLNFVNAADMSRYQLGADAQSAVQTTETEE